MTDRRRGPPKFRFARLVDRNAANGCWEWKGAKTRKGYGSFNWGGGQSVLAHRASWEIHFGKVADGLHVCHHCDNPSCVNPQHLFLGTNNDNVADRVAKGRSARLAGALNPRARLTARDVAVIRGSGVSSRKLAAQYGVGKTTIQHILAGRNWPDIPAAQITPN